MPPADPAITGAALQSCGGKAQEAKPFIVAGDDFLYLLMLHVLPKGFQRTRCYGFLNPCSRRLIKFLQLILRVPPFFFLKQKKTRATITCPVCGATMNIVKTRIRKPPADFAVCLT
jgi:hypothetical protein